MTIIAESHNCLKNLALPEYFVYYQKSILENVKEILMSGWKLGREE